MFIIEEIAQGDGVIESFECPDKAEAIRVVGDIRARGNFPALGRGEGITAEIAQDILMRR